MPELTLENTDLGADLASHLGRFHGVGLRDNVQLTDTTIICQDGSVRAHQVNFSTLLSNIVKVIVVQTGFSDFFY